MQAARNWHECQRAAWIASGVKSRSSAYNNNDWISSWIWDISTGNTETMPRKLARQTFLTGKRHLLWAQFKNHTNPRHLHRFLWILLITTRNFNGSNPDGSQVLTKTKMNAYRAVCPGYPYAQMQSSPQCPDTAKITGPRTFADKRWVGPVKLLCIIMFNISKIRPKSLFGPVKAQKFSRCLSACSSHATNGHDDSLTPKHRDTHGCVVNTVATDALVLKHQAISIHHAD